MVWNQITPSSFPWERAALDYVKERLPGRHPYQAWSNFTFVSQQGHIREVDLLVASPNGLHLIEIKNFKGRLTNQGSTWILDDGRHRPPFDSPVPLADLKAKELKSLLTAAGRGERMRMPYVTASIFLAERGMKADLSENQRHHLYGVQGNVAHLPHVMDLIEAPPQREPIDQQFARRLHQLLQKVGIHRTQKSISIGPWRIEPQPYESGPTWQDHHARRPDNEAAYRRARIYLYEREDDPEARESTRLAAQREFAAGQGIQHPGLLVPADMLDHEMGPALLIDQSPDAQRLDHWLVARGNDLDLPQKLGLIRQLAEAVRYAHDRRLVHRALSPRAVIVEDLPDEGPRLRVGEWQTAARGLSSTKTRHRVLVTSHAGRHVEQAAQAYLAPEFREDADGTTTIDVFGLGATAYLMLTGKAPASTPAELLERILNDDGLHPKAVDDSLPDDVDAFVAEATRPIVSDRCQDIEDFLTLLSIAEGSLRESVHPDPEPDPYEAGPDDVVGGEYRVISRLGTGATARALLVRRDHEEAVLKIGRDDKAAARLDDESAVLADLANDHVVRLRRGAFPLGNRTAIEVTLAGQTTLSRYLREEGALLPDMLQRYGSQLLDAVAYLERNAVRHRDIKPDNIGVLTRAKRGTSAVLFDFSLAGIPDADITAGTNGYRDPMLGTARRPTWDHAADRYGAAVTLHEMASLELPTWGDDGSDPRVTSFEAAVSEEVFTPALRGPLTTFFRRAFAREASDRHPSAEAMRRAWDDVFTEADSTGPATTLPSMSDDPQDVRDRVASLATLDSALDTAGLSPRAVAVAQRLGASTVGQLLVVPVRDLWRARGLSKPTRDELLRRVREWQDRLETGSDSPPVEAPGDDDAPLSLDLLVGRLIPTTPKRGADQAAIVRAALGLPDDRGGRLPDARWPTVKAVADRFGLAPRQLNELLDKQRHRWSGDAELAAARAQVMTALRQLGRVATAGELADQLLAIRGCPSETDPARRQAYGFAALRAVVEGEDPENPRFGTRRHHDRMLIALQVTEDEDLDTPSDFALLEVAARLGDKAVELAAREPLPTPTTVVRELSTISGDTVPGIVEQRLVRLAAAASESVLANARLELYPADLSPARALRLSQAGAAIPPDGLEPEVFESRVATRFPGLPPLPSGAALRDLLRSMDIAVDWTGKKIRPVTTTAASSSLFTPAPVASDGADPRLDRVLQIGGVRIVTARRSRWQEARSRLAAATGATVHDAGTEFATTMREIAAERGVRSFATVLRADADDAPDRARTNLAKIVELALARLESSWRTEPVLALDGLTPFGRYDGAMAMLERLMSSARNAGRDGGPSSLVLLCVAADERAAPHVDRAAIGMVSSEEWLVASPAWLEGTDAA